MCSEFVMNMSAACLCRPPLLPRMPRCPLAVARPAHPLALVFSRLCPAHGGAGQPHVAVAASQLPAQLEASQQAGLALDRDPLTPFAGQVPDAAQTSRTVSRAHTAGHLWGWRTHGPRSSLLLMLIVQCGAVQSVVVSCQSLTFCPVEAVSVAKHVCFGVSLSVYLAVRQGRSPLSSVTAFSALRGKTSNYSSK